MLPKPTGIEFTADTVQYGGTRDWVPGQALMWDRKRVPSADPREEVWTNQPATPDLPSYAAPGTPVSFHGQFLPQAPQPPQPKQVALLLFLVAIALGLPVKRLVQRWLS